MTSINAAPTTAPIGPPLPPARVGAPDHGSSDDAQFVAARQVGRRRTEPSGQQDGRRTRVRLHST
jgi:hypothetical protein